MKRTTQYAIFSSFILIVGGLIYTLLTRPQPSISAQVLTGGSLPTGFAQAEGPIPLPFPESYGPHPDYQTEWWYYTGNLDTTDGRHFGYQLTIFRRALLPAGERTERDSAWGADQVYFAHFAFTDAAGETFYNFERFSRGAAGLAGAQADPYRVWLEDWEIRETGSGQYHLEARQDRVTLSLDLIDEKGPVLQGDRGYSQKGSEPGAASYYYSQPRLQTTGTVTIDGQSHPVVGLSWKDHEFSTSALAPGQVGWDWFALQLNDGTDLMLFHLRRDDGSIDPYSSGTLIYPDGSTDTLTRDDFTITAQDTWRSLHSGAEYPAGWQIELPAYDLSLRLVPYLADQELQVSVIYWEGAVRIAGTYQGHPVIGNGYVELTGYAHSMEGGF